MERGSPAAHAIAAYNCNWYTNSDSHCLFILRAGPSYLTSDGLEQLVCGSIHIMSEEKTYLANSASHDDKGGRIGWMDKVGRTLGKRSGRRWIKESAAIGETGE